MARNLASLVFVLVATAGASALMPGTAVANGATRAASLDSGVLTQLNQIRLAHGLAPLTLSVSLSEAADQHSRDMVANGYFAHNSANGAPFWKRIRSFYADRGYGYWSVGENLFWSSGPINASASLRAWMASPEHRANILNPAWRQIGVAAISSRHAPGAYAGHGVTVITTDFGVRHP